MLFCRAYFAAASAVNSLCLLAVLPFPTSRSPSPDFLIATNAVIVSVNDFVFHAVSAKWPKNVPSFVICRGKEACKVKSSAIPSGRGYFQCNLAVLFDSSYDESPVTDFNLVHHRRRMDGVWLLFPHLDEGMVNGKSGAFHSNIDSLHRHKPSLIFSHISAGADSRRVGITSVPLTIPRG
jgi:hypothetical protein